MSKLIGIVEGADFYLILSLIIFMAVFVMSIVYMLSLRKSTIDMLANMPLNEDDERVESVESSNPSN